MTETEGKRPWYRFAWATAVLAFVGFLLVAGFIVLVADLWELVFKYASENPSHGWIAAGVATCLVFATYGVVGTKLQEAQDGRESAIGAIRKEHAADLERVHQEAFDAAGRRRNETLADLGQAKHLLGELAEGGETRRELRELPGDKYFRRALADSLVGDRERWSGSTKPIYDEKLQSALGAAGEALRSYEASLSSYRMRETDGPVQPDMQVRMFDAQGEYDAFLRDQPALRRRLLQALVEVDNCLYELRVEVGGPGG